MSKRYSICISLFSVLSALLLLTACGTGAPGAKNDQWEVTVLSSADVFRWNRIERFAGGTLNVLELEFHRLDSPQKTTVSLNDLSLTGWEDKDKPILALTKDSSTKMFINGNDVSEIEFLYCEAQAFSNYGCSYRLSAEGGLPAPETLTEIDKILKDRNPEIILETDGDTLHVTLAFDPTGGKEDLILKFASLPEIKFTIKD